MCWREKKIRLSTLLAYIKPSRPISCTSNDDRKLVSKATLITQVTIPLFHKHILCMTTSYPHDIASSHNAHSWRTREWSLTSSWWGDQSASSGTFWVFLCTDMTNVTYNFIAFYCIYRFFIIQLQHLCFKTRTFYTSSKRDMFNRWYDRTFLPLPTMFTCS